jgi:hypothetical protein
MVLQLNIHFSLRQFYCCIGKKFKPGDKGKVKSGTEGKTKAGPEQKMKKQIPSESTSKVEPNPHPTH